jgi:hypothetical protein
VARIDELLRNALEDLPEKPPPTAKASEKKRFSELISQAVALAFAEELRYRNLVGARPTGPGDADQSGAERRMAGGIGAKKVDVTWSTEECGLLLAISIKTINAPPFQKNLTNRRGDMLFESVTLHRRFPYAVLAGFLFLDKGAADDATKRRRSTFVNAHRLLWLFSGRDDPADRDEQYEKLYIILLDANKFDPKVRTYAVGDSENTIQLGDVFDELIAKVATRNPDHYDKVNGKLRKVRSRQS